MGKYKKVYVEGRGYIDIAKNLFDKLSPAVQTLAKTAVTKAAEVGGDKLGAFVATRVAEKVLPQKPSQAAIMAIENIEQKIKSDIESFSGKGFKLSNY